MSLLIVEISDYDLSANTIPVYHGLNIPSAEESAHPNSPSQLHALRH